MKLVKEAKGNAKLNRSLKSYSHLPVLNILKFQMTERLIILINIRKICANSLTNILFKLFNNENFQID